MQRSIGTLLGMLALAMLPCDASAVVDWMDRSFGSDGWRTYGFQPIGADFDDSPYVACPAPNGTLLVAGAASNGQRIVTIRLLADGNLDTSFSADGKESFTLPGEWREGRPAPATCLPDGDFILARATDEAGSEQNLQIIRVDGATGLLDPAFAIGGVRTVDLDSVRSGLGLVEAPRGINYVAGTALGNHVLITGYATLANGFPSGFIVRILLDGTLSAAAVPDIPPYSLGYYASAAGVHPGDGRVWLGAVDRPPFPSFFIARLDVATLAYVDILHGHGFTVDAEVEIGKGQMLGNGTFVQALGVRPTVDGRTRVALLRARSSDSDSGLVYLPDPMPIEGEPVEIDRVEGKIDLTLAPGRTGDTFTRVLYAAPVRVIDSYPRGQYLAQYKVGVSAAEDSIDSDFGAGGSVTVHWDHPLCPESVPSFQAHGRVTALWQSLPTLVAMADTDCLGGLIDFDYLVGRLRGDRIFAHGFQIHSQP